MAYEHYVKLFNLTWTKPKYHEDPRLPRIPLEQHIDLIMANSPLKLRTAISLSKETGLRPVELMRATLREIDLTQKTIYPRTAKHGSARVLSFSNRTLSLLNEYILRYNVNTNETLFGTWNSNTYGKWFRHYRNKTAKKMQDPIIKTIRLYDLRHFFATMLYKRTNNLLLVKMKLGHRRIDTTLIYTQLINFGEEEYSCEIATDKQEAKKLIESGFEYTLTTPDGYMLFRKRK